MTRPRLRARAGSAPPCSCAAATVASNSAALGQRPGPVVDRDHVDLAGLDVGAQRRRAPRHSESCRVGPPSTSSASGPPRCVLHQPAHGVPSSSAGATTTTRSTYRQGAGGAQRPGQHRRPRAAAAAPCWSPAPTRLPEPAATSTTAARGRAGGVGHGPSLPDPASGVTQRFHGRNKRTHARQRPLRTFDLGDGDAERAAGRGRRQAAATSGHRSARLEELPVGAGCHGAGARPRDRGLPDPGRARLRDRQPRPVQPGLRARPRHRRHPGRRPVRRLADARQRVRPAHGRVPRRLRVSVPAYAVRVVDGVVHVGPRVRHR